MDSLKNIINSLVNKGIFGPAQFLQINIEENNKGIQMGSDVTFASITINNGFSNIAIPIFIKTQLTNVQQNDVFNYRKQFWIEVFMYTKVLPFIDATNLKLFPKMYYGNATCGDDYNKDIIILQNLTKDEFCITKEKLFLDYNHIVIALRKLAEFHALSYIRKSQDNVTFSSIVEKLTFSKFYTENTPSKQFFTLSSIRSINLLIDYEKKEMEVLNKIKEKFLLNFKEVVTQLLKPIEPFAVICHGDFCRNNILYKYDKIEKKPIDVKFIDLQNSIYSNPVIDLAFLLYMNTTAELRNEHWDTFLSTYWNTLNGLVPNIQFTYKEFVEHFAKHALYGLIPISFFVPIINEKITPLKDAYHLPYEEREMKFLNIGGEETCKILLDITKHMLDQKYFHKFLELSKSKK